MAQPSGQTAGKGPLNDLEQRLPECMAGQRPVFRKRLQGLRRRQAQGRPVDRGLKALAADMDASVARRHARAASIPRPDYPDDLPVSHRRDDIARALQAHQVVVVCGETGSGKSTQLPKLCLELGLGVDGMIGHTQPRRLAARSLAQRIADELRAPLGEAVGYKVRFTDQVSERTHIKLLTDGMLLAEIQGDRDLLQYDTLIIDEAHERSLNIDFLLGYLKRLLPRRPDLKVIITSATIDPERFSRHFDDAPVIEVSGRSYPVDVRYRPLEGEDEDSRDRNMLTGILDAVDELSRAGPGDILVFLSGERDIRDAAEALRKHHPPHTEVMPLYARLSAAEQQRVFAPHTGRRIILATNVAETSVTVPGIRYVVDTGIARISRYSYRTKVQRLPIEPISRASANQRAGRCGRVAPGICIRLYSEEDYLSRPEFTDPEIARTNLASVILQMEAQRLGAVEDFPFVEPPDRRFINDGYKLLHELGAVDGQRRLTALGQRLARLPVDPAVARMLLAGDTFGALREVLVIAAALSIQDPRERPLEARQAADQAHAAWKDEHSDFVSYLKLWDAWQAARAERSRNKQRAWAREHFLSHVRLRDWMDIHRQLKELVGSMGLRFNQEAAPSAELHRALLTGMLANVATRSEEQEYTGARNLKLLIFPGSGLARRRPKWIMAAEIVETTRVFARTAAQVDPADVERLGAHLVQRHYSDPHWDPRQGRVVAFETVSLYGLVLAARRKVHFGPIDPVVAREVFLRQGLAEDRVASKGAFLAHNRALVSEIQELEAKSRRRDVLVDEESLYAFYDSRVPADVVDLKSFEGWRRKAEREIPKLLFMRRDDLMQHQAESVTSEQFPDRLAAGDLRLPLNYHFEPGHPADGVTVQVPLAALNQLRPEPFEWLVPGLLEEKVTALIRGLPKSLRKNFVPAPDFARAVLDRLKPGEGSLVDGVRRELRSMTGVDVPPEQWDTARLEPHFHMNFQVVDAQGQTLDMARDLAGLQERFGEQARADVGALKPDPGLEREGITRWDFGTLPAFVEYQQQGVSLKAYPALVDEGNSVALRLLDDPQEAEARSRAGVRRLLMIALRDQVRYLSGYLPDLDRMALQYSPLGNTRALRDGLMAAIVDRVFLAGGVPRDEQAFAKVLERGRAELVPSGERFARQAAAMLDHYHTLRQVLKKPRGLEGMESFRDMAEHLDELVFANFLLEQPPVLLERLPRYLEGLRYRMDKQAADPARDAQRTRQLRPWWERYLERRERHRRQGIDDPALLEFRIMLEEYRISVFAQPLGAAMPVSEKRLKEAWARVR